MDIDVTELIFILDRSGSMAGKEEDVVGGYNAFLAKQEAGKGRDHGHDGAVQPQIFPAFQRRAGRARRAGTAPVRAGS